MANGGKHLKETEKTVRGFGTSSRNNSSDLDAAATSQNKNVRTGRSLWKIAVPAIAVVVVLLVSAVLFNGRHSDEASVEDSIAFMSNAKKTSDNEVFVQNDINDTVTPSEKQAQLSAIPFTAQTQVNPAQTAQTQVIPSQTAQTQVNPAQAAQTQINPAQTAQTQVTAESAVDEQKIKSINEVHTFETETAFSTEGYEVKESGSPIPTIEKFSSENIMNILVIGSDKKIEFTDDKGRADLVMLVSIDKDNNKVKLSTFERAIGVPVEGQNDAMLNELLNIGGTSLICDTISDCFRIEIDGFVHVDYDAFINVFKIIDGIDLEFTQEEANHFNARITLDKKSTFVAQPGLNHLPAYEALIYCRLRDSDDNFGRQQRVRSVLTAAIDKLKELGISQIIELSETVIPLVHTDLSAVQILKLLAWAPGMLDAETSQLAVPQKDKMWIYSPSKDLTVYGFDFLEETNRLHDFILN